MRGGRRLLGDRRSARQTGYGLTMSMTATARDRARGAVLGLAWGDALGCPVEGWRAAEIARHFGRYETLPNAYPPSVTALPTRRLRPLGLHSDDTQQALALLAVTLDPAGWSVQTWGEWLIAGAQSGAWRGTGRNFNAAVAALRRGVPPQESGSPSAGIGAAMRVGPLGAALACGGVGLKFVLPHILQEPPLRTGSVASDRGPSRPLAQKWRVWQG